MKKEIIAGLFGGVGLLLFYFLVMGVSSGSWSATISQFRQLWYWILILAGGFGVQIGLYTKLKTQISLLRTPTRRASEGQAKSVTAASTGTSAVGMIACCAHHLTDLLPIIGLSGAALFLTKYQIPLIILGVVMNVFGILYMIRTIRNVKTSHL